MDEYVAVTLNSNDDLFNMMRAMNQARVEEIAGTMCWNCNHFYPINHPSCPKCGAVNGNMA